MERDRMSVEEEGELEWVKEEYMEGAGRGSRVMEFVDE